MMERMEYILRQEYTALYNGYAREILKEVDALMQSGKVFTEDDRDYIENMVAATDLLLKHGSEHHYFYPESKLLALFFQGVKFGIQKTMDGTLVVKRNRIKAASATVNNESCKRKNASEQKHI